MIVNCVWKSKIILFLGCFFCIAMISACMFTFNSRANERLKQLESLLDTIPVVTDSKLIKHDERIVRSHVPKCGRVQIWQLFGTNAMTFQEVLDYYEAHVDQNTWQIERVDENGASFTESKNINLGISQNLNWPSSFMQDVQSEQTKFKTLFLISLGGFIDPSMSVEQCT